MGWVHNGRPIPPGQPFDLDTISKWRTILAVSIVLTALMITVVGLRAYTRGHLLHVFGADDWVIFFSAVSYRIPVGALYLTFVLDSYVLSFTLHSASIRRDGVLGCLSSIGQKSTSTVTQRYVCVYLLKETRIRADGPIT